MSYSLNRSFLTLLCCICFQIDAVAGENKDLKHRIESLMADYEAIGISVVVVKDKRILYYKSYGYNPDYQDAAKKKTIKRNDTYYMASISKTFVGTAIMQLVERGILRLDDDVNKYLDFKIRNPYFPNDAITVRMLLAHTSSISKLKGKITFDKFDIIVTEKNSNYIRCYNKFKPGTKTEYSNLGYVILGAVIEKVSGLRFDEYVQKNIIEPLGIYGGFNPALLDSNRFVKTYKYKNGIFIKQPAAYKPDKNLRNYVLGYSTPALHPADGLITSAYDLAKYMIMHMNNGLATNGERIISEKSEMLLRDKSIHNLYYTTKYIPNVRLIGMNGGARGMHTEMFFSPDKGFGFVILCNGCNSAGSSDSGLNKLVMRELYNTFILKGDTKK